jgi:hypothetical protein
MVDEYEAGQEGFRTHPRQTLLDPGKRTWGAAPRPMFRTGPGLIATSTNQGYGVGALFFYQNGIGGVRQNQDTGLVGRGY